MPVCVQICLRDHKDPRRKAPPKHFLVARIASLKGFLETLSQPSNDFSKVRRAMSTVEPQDFLNDLSLSVAFHFE